MASSTGKFVAANGIITTPNGQPFVADGINIFGSQTGAATQILTLFRGVNMVRVAVQDLATATPSSLLAFIAQMTSAGVVVVLEDHTSAGGDSNVLSGAALTRELSWYSSMASAFASNPYVWFATMNEPDDPTNEAAATSQEVAIYNTIRAAGDANPIMLEQIGGFSNTVHGGLATSAYAKMTNVVWDTHYYGWVSDYSTNQATVNAALAAQIANAKTIKTAEGVVPVIVGEYGVSTTGSGSADPNGNQVVTAVQTSGSGSVAWALNAGTDRLVDTDSNHLTTFGQMVATHIAASAKAAAAKANAVATTHVAVTATHTTTAAGTNNSIVLTGGNGKTNLVGSRNLIYSGAGTSIITETGGHNTFVIPVAGQGMDTIIGNVLSDGSALNFVPALRATAWTGTQSTLQNFLHLQQVNGDETISISATAGGAMVKVATLANYGSITLGDLVAHAIL